MNILRALIVLVILIVVGTGIFIWSGIYDIGADAPHTRPVAALLEALRERSVAAHASAIHVPDLDSPDMLAEGAEHYSAMCTGCHLAPGMTDSEIRPGLYPQPPNLSKHGVHDPAQAFWVIKHGIKMSGMPAWGKTHTDEQIWNIVAFVQKLPSMSTAEYQRLTQSSVDHEHDDHNAVHQPDETIMNDGLHDHDEDANGHEASQPPHDEPATR